MNRLSVELVQSKLMEADEVKKASVASLKLRNKGKKEIKNPTAGLSRSERFDSITQIVQDPSFTADVAPKKGDDNPVPQADFAEKYADSMEHGKTAGMGKGENEKSPKAVGVTGMNPNQTTKLKQVGDQWGKVAKTEDDGNQDIFTIPQADYAEEYTDSMDHGRAGGTTNEEGGDAAPSKRTYDKMAGGPTRAGGKRDAKLGNDAVGSKNKDSQKVAQVDGPGKETAPSDAFKWGSHEYKKETHGAHNVYENVQSGVTLSVNGKKKATFEIVNPVVLKKMTESYVKHGYKVELERGPVAWKQDKRFLRLVRESVHASYNNAPNTAKNLRKAAMQHFGQLCKSSYNSLYENRQDFVQTMAAAYKKIEKIAESKYLDGLEFFSCMARVVEGDQTVDLEIMTQATDTMMAARNIRNKIQEEFGFDTEIRQIFVDGKKINPAKIVEFKPAVKSKGKKKA